MYSRLIRRNQRLSCFILKQDKCLAKPQTRDFTGSPSYRLTNTLTNHFTRKHPSCIPIASGNSLSLSQNSQLRRFSSEGDGAGEDNLSKEKTGKEKSVLGGVNRFDSHAQLGKQDQIDWLNNEKLASESKKESPFLNKRERLKNEFSRRIQPWETIQLSFESFPYYLQ